MSAAPETKYTDRDVRIFAEESSEIIEMVYEYIERYTGEFEYLIDMKMRLAQGYDLTTPMLRGVLNCMRHDPRVTGLPTPLPPEEGVVVELRAPRRSKRRARFDRDDPHPCSRTESHDAHVWWEGDNSIWCEGVPWAINRHRDPHYPAKIKVPFVVAKGGGLVHSVAENGHYYRWRQQTHEWGFWRVYTDYDEPELIVNLVCRFPSVLKNPNLITIEQAEQIIQACGIRWCPHCADG